MRGWREDKEWLREERKRDKSLTVREERIDRKRVPVRESGMKRRRFTSEE